MDILRVIRAFFAQTGTSTGIEYYPKRVGYFRKHREQILRARRP